MLENILQQAAARVYLEQVLDEASRGAPVEFHNLTRGGTNVTAQDTLYSAADEIQFAVDGMTLTGTYSSKYASDEQFGTFVIQFTGPDADDECQISLVVPASVDTRSLSVGVTTTTDSDAQTRTDVREQTDRTTITWSDPMIRKGAVG